MRRKPLCQFLNFTNAPAHIGQGSSVTYSVQPLSLHPPKVEQALSIASISACAVAFFSFSRRLYALEITSPLPFTTIAPTGISPIFAASLARESAIFFSHTAKTGPRADSPASRAQGYGG